MALDYSTLSDSELEAIANNDYSKLSDATLNAIANSSPAQKAPDETIPVAGGAELAGPAITAFGYGAPTGLTQLGKDVAQAGAPLIEAGKQAFQGYTRSPGKAIVDVGAAHLGIPPPYATAEGAKGLYNTYKAAMETGKNLSEALSKLPAGTDKIAEPFINSLRPDDLSKLNNLIKTQGLEKGLKTFPIPEYMGPEATQSLNSLKNSFPGTMSKIGAVAGPLARGVARVAGPVGMAANLYDAGQMARQTQLGERLQQGQGQRAEQAYRNMNTQYGAQLSPQEAQNVLASGNMRDIASFGGADRLNMAVRLQAAKRILGQ